MQEEALATQLAQNGYCVAKGILDPSMLAQLRQGFSGRKLAKEDRRQFGESGGFIVADYHDPVMVRLLTWPKTLQTLRSFGFTAPKLHNFYVSTKPPQAAALPWHSDLFYRYDEPTPAELFLIYYLQDTSPQNGCLRVVPGSHHWPHENRHMQASNAARRDDEVDVCVHAGDLFIGDRRILHATHANDTDTWRTCLTIAYAPQFAQLPEPIQARIVQNPCLPPAGWQVQDVDPQLAKILPRYTGTAEPVVLDD